MINILFWVLISFHFIDTLLVVYLDWKPSYWANGSRGRVYSPLFQGYMYTRTLKTNPDDLAEAKSKGALTKYEVEITEFDIVNMSKLAEFMYAFFRKVIGYLVAYAVLLSVIYYLGVKAGVLNNVI